MSVSQCQAVSSFGNPDLHSATVGTSRPPKIRNFVKILTCIEFIACVIIGLVLSWNYELLGACMIQKIPHHVFYIP